MWRTFTLLISSRFIYISTKRISFDQWCNASGKCYNAKSCVLLGFGLGPAREGGGGGRWDRGRSFWTLREWVPSLPQGLLALWALRVAEWLVGFACIAVDFGPISPRFVSRTSNRDSFPQVLVPSMTMSSFSSSRLARDSPQVSRVWFADWENREDRC